MERDGLQQSLRVLQEEYQIVVKEAKVVKNAVKNAFQMPLLHYYYICTVSTVEALVSGNPWDVKKVSVTGAGCFKNGSHKQPIELSTYESVH